MIQDNTSTASAVNYMENVIKAVGNRNQPVNACNGTNLMKMNLKWAGIHPILYSRHRAIRMQRILVLIEQKYIFH